MAGLTTKSHVERCEICAKENVVKVTHGPGGGWDEDNSYACAYCGKHLGRRKAFAIEVEKLPEPA